MESDLIYDIGMCDGADTAFYLAKGFRVVGLRRIQRSLNAIGSFLPRD
jgi:hypothetical protein